MFSRNGYKRNSPDRFNKLNIIKSSNITMKDVLFPVMGIDNLGNKILMQPEGEYQFSGDYVIEFPMRDYHNMNGKWANQDGGGLSAGAWGAIGQGAGIVTGTIAGIFEQKAQNKTNSQIASWQNQTQIQLSKDMGATQQSIEAAHNQTALEVAAIQAKAEQNSASILASKPTIDNSGSDKSIMAIAGAVMIIATIGIFYLGSKHTA